MIPAEIWRRNSKTVTKLIIRKKRVKSIELDPAHQTADADYSNNSFPPVMRPGRLKMYKSDFKQKSMMADMLVELKSEEEKEKPKGSDKDMPMTEGEKSMKNEVKTDKSKKDTAKKDKAEAKPKNDKTEMADPDTIEKPSKSEKEKSSLRRTLEKMMGKK